MRRFENRKPICPRCRGTGRVEHHANEFHCNACNGTGRVTPEQYEKIILADIAIHGVEALFW